MTTPVHIALLALPESTASTLYGMYDLFKSAGRDWNFLTEGQPGPELIKVTITSAIDRPFSAANGITIHPQHHINEIKNPDVICVPDIFVMPGESLANRFEAEKNFLRSAYANGTTIATACSAALLLAEAGLLDGWQATTHWGYCDVEAVEKPKKKVKSAGQNGCASQYAKFHSLRSESIRNGGDQLPGSTTTGNVGARHPSPD